jgi:hypothetical protein
LGLFLGIARAAFEDGMEEGMRVLYGGTGILERGLGYYEGLGLRSIEWCAKWMGEALAGYEGVMWTHGIIGWIQNLGRKYTVIYKRYIHGVTSYVCGNLRNDKPLNPIFEGV